MVDKNFADVGMARLHIEFDYEVNNGVWTSADHGK